MSIFKPIFLFIVLAFQSCIYNKVTHLSDEDLEWIDTYDVGDTILFVSNHGNTDIMIIADYHIDVCKMKIRYRKI